MNIRSTKSGFSFIEVVLSTLVISVVGAFLATAIPSSLVAGQEVQDLSRATDLAQRYMETVKSELSYKSSFDSVTEGANSPVDVTADFTDNGYFTVQANVTNLETDTISGVSMPVLIQVDVEYLKASNSLSLIKISTLISRPE